MFTERVSPATQSIATFDHCEVVNFLKAEEVATPDELVQSGGDGVVIYPNPASREVTVLYPYSGNPVTLTLNTLEGKLMKAFVINKIETSLDIHELTAGMYFLRFENKEGVLVKRLIIE